MTFDTSASNGPITLNNIKSGAPGTFFSYNGLSFNAGSGTLTISGSSTFNYWNANAPINLTGQITGSGNLIGTAQGGSGILTFNNPGSSTPIPALSPAPFNFVVKTGTGTQTLSGTSTYSGATTVNAGTLLVTGSLINTALNAGNASGSGNGTLTFNTPSTLTLSTLVAGQSTGDVGTVNLNGGVLNFSSFFDIGNNGTALTSTYNQTAGTVTTSGVTYIGNAGQASFNLSNGTYNAAGGAVINQSSTGTSSMTLSGTGIFNEGGANNFVLSQGAATASVFTQTGGTFNFTSSGFVDIGNSGPALVSISGGTFTVTTGQIFVGHGAAATLSLSGTGTVTAPFLDLGYSGGGSTASGVVNLGNGSAGGTLTVGGIRAYGSGASKTFNFNGGTLKASANDVTFLNGGTGTQTIFNVQANSTIDNGGFGITIVPALLNGTTGAGMTYQGAGTTTLTGSSTYNGLTTISAGVLSVNNVATGVTAQALGENASLTLTGGSTLLYTGASATLDKAITIGTGNGNLGGSGGGTLTLSGGITKNGTTLTFSSGNFNITTHGITGALAHSDLIVSGSTLTLTATNSYNGPTTIQNSGTINLGANNVFPTAPSTDLTINTSGTLNMAGFSDQVASLTGDSTGIVNNTGSTASTLTLNTTGSNTFAGVIKNTGTGTTSIIMAGTGTQTLGGANTYTGGTTVSNGKMIITGTISASSPIVVGAGAYLSLVGLNATGNSPGSAGTYTINGGTISNDGASTTITQVINNNLTLNGGTLAATAPFNTTYGNFVLFTNGGAQVIVTGSAVSTISAAVALSGNHTFNVADVTSGVDLMVTGELLSNQNILSGAIIKTGAGTLDLANPLNSTNPGAGLALSGVQLNAGQVIFVNGGLGTGISFGGGAVGYKADFTGNSTLTWDVGNTQDISIIPTGGSLNGGMRIEAGIIADPGHRARRHATRGTGYLCWAGVGAGITKIGSGTLTLGGSNTYTGNTTINASGGTLQIGGSFTTNCLRCAGGHRAPVRAVRWNIQVAPPRVNVQTAFPSRGGHIDQGYIHQHLDPQRKQHLHRRHHDQQRRHQRRQCQRIWRHRRRQWRDHHQCIRHGHHRQRL